MKRYVLCLLFGFVLLAASLGGCEDNTQVCPPILTAGDLTSHLDDNLKCCDALEICCKEVTDAEEKKKCDGVLSSGGVVSCQAEYHSQISFERCKPVYVRDYPHLTPKKTDE